MGVPTLDATGMQCDKAQPTPDRQRGRRVLYDSHLHTAWCGHATGLPAEYAQVAIERGLQGVVFTDHNPMPPGYAKGSRMVVDDFDDYIDAVLQLQQEYRGRLDVRLGLECDCPPDLPNAEKWIAQQTARADWDYLAGSIHCQFREYIEAYWNNDIVAFQCGYFDHLAQVAETGLFDAITHADFIKNTMPEHWQPDRVWDAVRGFLDRVAASGVAMELNTSGLNKAFPEWMPSVPMLAEMQQRGIAVVLGSDAHEPGRVGASFAEALDTLEKVGYRDIGVFLNRRLKLITIAQAKQSLSGRP